MRHILVPLYAIIIFLVLWELLVWVNDWPNYKMASPSDIWPAFWKFKVLFFQYGWDTLWRTVVGLFIAVFCGVFLGMIMGFSKVLREAIYPLLVDSKSYCCTYNCINVCRSARSKHYFNSIYDLFFSYSRFCLDWIVNFRT